MDPNQPTSRPIFAEMFCEGLWKLGWVLSFINKCKLLKCLWLTDIQYVAPESVTSVQCCQAQNMFCRGFNESIYSSCWCIEGSQMLFYVWFEFTSWLRGVGQGKGAWDCFLTIWAWDSCAFCQWDQWLLRDWTFILQMTLSWPDVDSLGLLPSALMFCLNLKKSLLQSWL